MSDTYLTISGSSEGYYYERGSRFLSFAEPLSPECDVRVRLGELRKRLHDARHQAYAYVTGFAGETQRACDDGEPANSAGMPILGQIRSANLTNTLIVVVRYFGGTKLGIPGLINAYKTAAKAAIDNNKIVVGTVDISFCVDFDYSEMNFVMRVLKDCGANILRHDFDGKNKIFFTIRQSSAEKIVTSLKTNFRIKIYQL